MLKGIVNHEIVTETAADGIIMNEIAITVHTAASGGVSLVDAAGLPNRTLTRQTAVEPKLIVNVHTRSLAVFRPCANAAKSGIDTGNASVTAIGTGIVH